MLTVTVLTRDSQQTLAQTLASTTWAPEVIVLDTGSADGTLEIASKFDNVQIHTAPFAGFGAHHNQMAALAQYDWILSLDSDEILSKALAEEIQSCPLDPGTVYTIPRCNLFRGKWIRGCGWWPDRVARLYHRKQTRFSSDTVHERVLTEGMALCALHHPITHQSYRSIDDFLSKMRLYTDLFAKQYTGKRRSSLARALLAKWMAFIKSYFLKRGFLDGTEGWVISSYNAQTAYYKYLKLWEQNALQKAAVPRREGESTESILSDP